MPSIVVDPRAGSKELIPYLRKLGMKVETERMEFGDLAWIGNGPDGPVAVGLEHKRVDDMLACIKTGRFAGHQLPGLLDSYSYVILMIEGEMASDAMGDLVVRRGKKWTVPEGAWRHRHPVHWIASICWQAGVRVIQTRDKEDSAAWIKSEFTWWTAKEWEEHKTLKTLDNTLQMRVQYTRPTYLRKFAATLPGIGWERSAAVAAHFKNIEQAVVAPSSEWSKIPGVGEVTARKVRTALIGGR